ncbi:hypothetical protein Bbelb_391700 [Branchiostoma belcheri]|nr:hypothetical protein Bbelb_391700 [Branchiostoma belcheri]
MSFEASRNSGTGLKLGTDCRLLNAAKGRLISGHHAFPTMREMGEESRAESRWPKKVKSRALTILPLVCWQCGETDTLPIPPEKLQEFQCIHPVCQGEKTAKEEAVKEEAVKEDETRIRLSTSTSCK